jgi:hypothetical protein
LVVTLLAAAYPWLLDLAHVIFDRRQIADASELVARAILAAAAMFVAPAGGLWMLLDSSRAGSMSLGDLRLRAMATLAMATPPLFTLIGVEFWLSSVPSMEKLGWLVIWLPIAFAAPGAVALRTRPVARRPPGTTWRVIHGVGALLLVFGFIGWHLANHLMGLAGPDVHLRVMHTLRQWYRSAAMEPALIALCALQLATGAVLARGWLAMAVGKARALQAGTGAYLGLYLVCHLNSVFVYARAGGTDTDFWFASGGRAGLMGDGWDVRLVPHYALAVLFLFVHLGAGLRVVLQKHRLHAPWLMRTAWTVGTLVALGAVMPLLRTYPA